MQEREPLLSLKRRRIETYCLHMFLFKVALKIALKIAYK